MNKRECALNILRATIKPLCGHGLGNVRLAYWLYLRIARALVPHVIEIGEHQRLEADINIDGVAKEMFLHGEYEPMTTEVFKRLLKSDTKVIDVGANIGYFTLLCSELAKKVYAFEPEERNFKILCENIKLNHRANVVTIQKAVGDINNKATLYLSRNESGEHSLIQGRVKRVKAQTEVDVVKLDDIIEDEIDLIKIDVEGNEIAVLRGAERLLRNPNIKLIVEVYPRDLKLEGTSGDELMTFLKEHEFEFVYLIDEHKRELQLTNTEDIVRHTEKHKFSTNILASKEQTETSS